MFLFLDVKIFYNYRLAAPLITCKAFKIKLLIIDIKRKIIFEKLGKIKRCVIQKSNINSCAIVFFGCITRIYKKYKEWVEMR